MWPIDTDPFAHRHPQVPRDLMRYTCGHEDEDAYLLGGFEVASMLNLALRKHFGRLVSDFRSALDFGCGTGRVTRHLDPTALYGCDVNGAVARLCSTSMPHGEFHQSPLMPPLRYPDRAFDLVCSFSVFSHLRLDVEQAWLAELVRVGAPGCVYLITVQGDWMIEATLPPAEAAQAKADGFSFRTVHQRHRNELDFPDYYESSWHTADWVRSEWGRHLEVVDVIRGDDAGRYLSGDLAFVPHGDVPVLRPMGQDLVVAVKR